MFVVHTENHHTFFAETEEGVVKAMTESAFFPSDVFGTSSALSKMRIGDRICIGGFTVYRMKANEAKKLAAFFGIAEEFHKEYGNVP